MGDAPAPQHTPGVEGQPKRTAYEAGGGPSSHNPLMAQIDEIKQMMLAMEEQQIKRLEDFRQESNAQYEALTKQEEACGKRNEEQYNELFNYFQAWGNRFHLPPPPPM